jgi:hypothetical protein
MRAYPTGTGEAEGWCFTGRLDNLPLPEILSFLSLNKKTGKMSLTRRGGQGLVVLRKGRIIYAASSSVRVTFGNILVCRGLITHAALAEALERQRLSQEEKRLGTVLVEMGQVSPLDVEEVMKYQTGLVLSELCQWASGFFRFDALDIPENREIEVDSQDFVVSEGMNTERLLLEVATQIDESGREGEATGSNAGDSDPGPGVIARARAPATPTVPLRGILANQQTHALRAEATLTLMRFAARIVSRGILFAVCGEQVTGIGHFGFAGEGNGSSPAHSLDLSLAEPSVFAEVVLRRESCRGPLEHSAGNERLIQRLGGEVPREAVVVPMIVAGSVAMIFYGDDLPHRLPLGEIRLLELVMTEAGLEMEKEALEGRIKSFELMRHRAEFLGALLGEDSKATPPRGQNRLPADRGSGEEP